MLHCFLYILPFILLREREREREKVGGGEGRTLASPLK
jgi:hypothetical protein